MVFSIFQANKKAKSAEVNANFAFISGNRLIAVNASTGAPIGTFPIGDLTAITNGSLAGDLLARTGNSLKVYNASGALIGSVSYDDMLNLQSASETHEGTIEIATNAEVAAGTDTSRAIVPSALLSLFAASSKAATGYARIPINSGGAFSEVIVQWGVGVSGTGNKTLTLPLTFPNAFCWVNMFNDDAAAERRFELSINSTSSFDYESVASGSTNPKWFAVGY